MRPVLWLALLLLPARLLAGEFQDPLAYYQEAIRLSRSAGNKVGEAGSMQHLADEYARRGDMRRAMQYYSEALSLWNGAGSATGKAETLSSLGQIHSELGEIDHAIDYYSQALPLQREAGDVRGEADTLNQVALLLVDLGQMQKALDYGNRALFLKEVVGDQRGEGIVLNTIGLIYHGLGDSEKALQYYVQALDMRKEAVDRSGEADTLNNMGKAYEESGKFATAVDFYRRSLDLIRTTGEPAGEGAALNNLGDANRSLGHLQEALDDYARALDIRTRIGDKRGQAETLNSMAAIRLSFGEEQTAQNLYGLALDLRRSVGDRPGEARTLYDLAVMKRMQGKASKAREYIEAAVDIVENLREQVWSQSLRASYVASTRSYYELLIGVLLDLHHLDPTAGMDAKALQVSERSHARSLMELLAESSANIREGADLALVERERRLMQAINAGVEKQIELSTDPQAGDEAAAISGDIRSITTEFEEVEGKIRKNSPHYAGLMKPEPLGLHQIQDDVLDDKTLLLEYALGNSRSYLWVAGKNSLQSYELPDRVTIEASVHRLYELLSGDKTGAKTRSQAEPAVGRAVDPRLYWKEAAALSQMLLGPAANDLKDRKLLIVPDGALEYLPFAALSVPGSGDVPLAAMHEIVTVPSASTLAVLRSETASRTAPQKMIAVLADPVFDARDERLDSKESSNRDSELHLSRLPFTRREAKEILSLVSPDEELEALDFDASRQTMTGPDLQNYRYVHLATHGFLNSMNPELSGIVLSLYDRDGNRQAGFLSASDVFQLKLNADMVVLSGCRTALGKEVNGEGLIGLTRAFLYAGAARVVASLWKVDDAATAQFMKDFYEGMLGEKKLSPAAALRAAQIGMWKEKRWQSPYYWAAFVLQGENR